MKTLILIFVSMLLITCSTSDLVDNWKNPEIDTYHAGKVLIVGMTSNQEARKLFEDQLRMEYEARNITAVTSYQYFENSRKSEDDLLVIEKKLVADGFDTILFSKIIGSETKERLSKSYRNVDNTYRKFRDDYYTNQDIYYNPAYYEQYPVYHAEASLYCICETKERELIWKGFIDITDPTNIKETVDDYVNLMVFILEENELLIKKEALKTSAVSLR